MDDDVAPGDLGQDLAERRQVEDVAQALAIGLDQDREAAIAAGDGQQVRRPLALLPERRARPGPTTRQEQGPGRVLAEPAGEQGGRGQLPDDEVLELVGIREEQRFDAIEWRIALRQPDRDAVVRPDRLDREAEALLESRLDRERPRRVDAAAERRQQAQPPVAQFVAESLDDDAPVRGQRAGRLALVVEVREQVGGGPVVEVVRLLEPGRRGRLVHVRLGPGPPRSRG